MTASQDLLMVGFQNLLKISKHEIEPLQCYTLRDEQEKRHKLQKSKKSRHALLLVSSTQRPFSQRVRWRPAGIARRKLRYIGKPTIDSKTQLSTSHTSLSCPCQQHLSKLLQYGRNEEQKRKAPIAVSTDTLDGTVDGFMPGAKESTSVILLLVQSKI